ncbi:MAG: hypothetical protein ABEI39_00115 [Halobacteriales archaeon]
MATEPDAAAGEGPEETDGTGTGGLVARLLGPLVVLAGLLSMPGALGWGLLGVGFLVTPRTRRELGELCRILCATRS